MTNIEMYKVAPPATFTLSTIAGMQPEQWVTVLTLSYLAILILEKLTGYKASDPFKWAAGVIKSWIVGALKTWRKKPE